MAENQLKHDKEYTFITDTFVTPGGKTIAMFYEGPHIKIKFTTGGEIPSGLQGVFTNTRQAKQAILKYISEDAPKPKLK